MQYSRTPAYRVQCTAHPAAHPHYFASLRDSFSRILPMAWPVAGELFGARKLQASGLQVHQAIWLALALALVFYGASLCGFLAWVHQREARATR